MLMDVGFVIYLKEVDCFKIVQGIDGDDVYGFVDIYLYILVYEFIGGWVNYGVFFYRFGVIYVLKDCEVVYGFWGVIGFVELVMFGIGLYDIQGWLGFNDWLWYNLL